MAITWKTVMGQSLADATKPLAYAQQSINSGFDALSKAMGDYQEGKQRDITKQDNAAVVAFKEALYNARTPEEFAAIQDSLNTQRSAMSPEARAQILGAEEKRRADLRTGQEADWQFDDALARRNQRAVVNEIERLNAVGDYAGARALLEQNPNLLDLGKVAGGITSSERGTKRFGWEEERHGFAVNDDKRAESREAREITDSALRNTLTGYQITDAQRKATEAANTDFLNRALADAAAEHAGNMGDMTRVIGDVAKQINDPNNPFPFHADGTLNVNAMTADQRAKLNAELPKWELPSVNTLMGGDTAAFKAAMDQARQSGRAFTPAQLEEAAQSGAKLFDTTADKRFGRDKETYDLNEGMEDLKASATNLQFGTVSTPETRENLKRSALDMLKDYAEPGTMRYRDYVKQVYDIIENGGIEVPAPDGSIQRILPNKTGLENILADMDRAWWITQLASGGKAAKDDITDRYETWRDDPRNVKYAKDISNEYYRQLRKKAFAPVNK